MRQEGSIPPGAAEELCEIQLKAVAPGDGGGGGLGHLDTGPSSLLFGNVTVPTSVKHLTWLKGTSAIGLALKRMSGSHMANLGSPS